MHDKKIWVISFLCAAAIASTSAAFLCTVGFRTGALSRFGAAQNLVVAGAIGAVFTFIFIASLLVLTSFPRILSFARARKGIQGPTFLKLSFSRKSIMVCSFLTMLFWIPYIILQYPVAMNADTYNQLYQFQTSSPTLYTSIGGMYDASYIDHHPVFDALVFGSFLWLGDIVGWQNGGLFLFSLCQYLLTAFAMGASCCYMERLKVPKAFRFISWLFITFMPYIPLWSGVMIKDSFFSVWFTWFFLLYIEVFHSKGKAFENKQFLFAFAIISLLCMLTKKTGPVIISLSLLVIVIYCIKNRVVFRPISVLIIVPLIHFLLIPVFIWPLIGGVEPGGRQESFGFAFQQVATVIVNDNDLSEDEWQAVSNVLNIKTAIPNYNIAKVDPVKNRALKTATSADYINFFKAYFTIGIRHIPEYTASVFHIAAGLLHPGRSITYNRTCQFGDWTQMYVDADTKGELHLDFYKPEPINSASRGFQDFLSKVSDTFPLNILFSRGFYGGWIPLICISLSLYAGRRSLVAFTPIILSVLVLLVCPIPSSRYILPLLYTTVLSLGLLCYFLSSCETR